MTDGKLKETIELRKRVENYFQDNDFNNGEVISFYAASLLDVLVRADFNQEDVDDVADKLKVVFGKLKLKFDELNK